MKVKRGRHGARERGQTQAPACVCGRGKQHQNRSFFVISRRSSTLSSVSHTRSICRVVMLPKNGSASVRVETYSQTGKSPGLKPNRSETYGCRWIGGK